eukprot:comp13545_c0_seq1/m.9116 comp13545_c0_seq1/g.9116  ORF comp13545_c0_seq1/g.9116 comp13545_c0_seq1/m.9116 type:complete len:701 (-) comp13545_c0_seq1:108-2210(-)
MRYEMWLRLGQVAVRPRVVALTRIRGIRHMSSTYELRPYQREAIWQSAQAFQTFNRQAVSMPVGSGKTVVFSHLIPLVPPPANKPTATKVLVLAHREELIIQARNKVSAVNGPKLRVEVEQSTANATGDADVVVASVQTLGRKNSPRLQRYDPDEYKLIIIDEAHHSTADSYLRILDHFGARDPKSHIKVWGCSATLKRNDRVALGHVYQNISYHISVLDIMRDNYLAPVRAFQVKTQVDISSVATQGDDFVQKQLSQAVDVASRNRLVVEVYKQHAVPTNRRSTLVFAVDVAHCHALETVFNDAGIPAKAVTGATKHSVRAETIGRFSGGDLPVLINCGVFTEGTDIPCIDCVIMARPTKSEILFQQILGRGMRMHPGKEYCMALDLVDVSKDKGLITIPSLLGLKPTFDPKGMDFLELHDRMLDLSSQWAEVLDAESLEEAERLLEEAELRKKRQSTVEEKKVSKEGVPEDVLFRATVRQYSDYKWEIVCDGLLKINVPGFATLTLTQCLSTKIYHLMFASADRGKTKPVLHRDWSLKTSVLETALPRADSILTEVAAHALILLRADGPALRGPISPKQHQWLSRLMGPNFPAERLRSMSKSRAAYLITVRMGKTKLNTLERKWQKEEEDGPRILTPKLSTPDLGVVLSAPPRTEKKISKRAPPEPEESKSAMPETPKKVASKSPKNVSSKTPKKSSV